MNFLRRYIFSKRREFDSFSKASEYCRIRNKNSEKEMIHKLFKSSEENLKNKHNLFELFGNSFLLYVILYYLKNNNGKCPFLVDFGGGAGASIMMLKKIFGDQISNKFSIVEQEDYVKESKNFKYSSALNYSSNLEEVIKNNKVNIFFSSGVIQYLREPLSFLKKLSTHKIPIVAFTRNNFSNMEKIQVQKCTFFEKKYFLVNSSLRKKDVIEIFLNAGYSILHDSPETTNSGAYPSFNYGSNLIFIQK